MGFLDRIAGALGFLRALSDEELEEQREALRLRYVSHRKPDRESQRLYDELIRYDNEYARRANEAYARENPEPREPRRRTHGWYLPNDD
ncbi:hypothetical protein [Paenarthrobacter sp. NPDC090522]|uniref:hypothetical protein n=1 Tax=Paenarthrobacter sp. NPDC090522 TaxID=3364383 RepID=UPI003810C3DF